MLNHQPVSHKPKQKTGLGVLQTVVRTPVTRVRKWDPKTPNHAQQVAGKWAQEDSGGWLFQTTYPRTGIYVEQEYPTSGCIESAVISRSHNQAAHCLVKTDKPYHAASAHSNPCPNSETVEGLDLGYVCLESQVWQEVWGSESAKRNDGAIHVHLLKLEVRTKVSDCGVGSFDHKCGENLPARGPRSYAVRQDTKKRVRWGV